MTNEAQCPQCQKNDIIQGKITSSFILPQWGLTHSFSPNSNSDLDRFRIKKKMNYCSSCGLLWQQIKEK